MDLVLFGIQGSGKGTQAKRLVTEHGYVLFEAGAELRRIAASGSELGNTVKHFIDQGHLAPHEIVMQVVKQAICSRPTSERILFDGIPRDLDQMRDFDRIMQECGREFRCIELKINEEEAMQRILQRALDQGRADDASQDSIRRRMGLFHEKTEPVITAYRERGVLQEVDGEGPVEEVFGRLVQVLA